MEVVFVLVSLNGIAVIENIPSKSSASAKRTVLEFWSIEKIVSSYKIKFKFKILVYLF